MNELPLTNRELASLLLLGALTLIVLTRSGRRETIRSVGSAISTLLSPKILVSVILYITWVLTSLIPLSRMGFWDAGLWKTTAVWSVISGFGLFLKLNDAMQRPRFFRKSLLRLIGLSAIVEYFVALESFPLWVEIPAQSLAVLFAGVAAVANRDQKLVPAGKLANTYLALFGFSALGWTAWRFAADFSTTDQNALVREFLLPLWLTPIALIYMYGFAVVSSYESCFIRMHPPKGRTSLTKQRLAIVVRAGGNLRTLQLLTGNGAQRVARANGFREAWREVEDIKQDARDRLDAKAAKQRRLVDNAGRTGKDESGRELDQREFKATRDSLRHLSACHMGHYRNLDRYRDDLLPIVESGFEDYGLPLPHDITMYVASDAQSWYAQRQTITGRWFGIGSMGLPPDEWLYDGPHPPSGFPAESEWDRWGGSECSKNWD